VDANSNGIWQRLRS